MGIWITGYKITAQRESEGKGPKDGERQQDVSMPGAE